MSPHLKVTSHNFWENSHGVSEYCLKFCISSWPLAITASTTYRLNMWLATPAEDVMELSCWFVLLDDRVHRALITARTGTYLNSRKKINVTPSCTRRKSHSWLHVSRVDEASIVFFVSSLGLHRDGECLAHVSHFGLQVLIISLRCKSETIRVIVDGRLVLFIHR